jgi:hypothetical protein
MKKHSRAALKGVVLIVITCSAATAAAQQWYVGGTLQHATIGQWQNSFYENRLATAASWAIMQPGVRKISSKSSTMDTVNPYAQELTGCIDKIAAGE